MKYKEINEIFYSHPIKLDDKGYALIYIPEYSNSKNSGWILCHRYLVEMKIGRELKKEEVIHHLDGNKQNNLIGNLMLFNSQKEHSSFHNKIRQFGYTQNIQKQIKERWKKFKNDEKREKDKQGQTR